MKLILEKILSVLAFSITLGFIITGPSSALAKANEPSSGGATFLCKARPNAYSWAGIEIWGHPAHSRAAGMADAVRTCQSSLKVASCVAIGCDDGEN